MGARCWLALAALFSWTAAADAAELRIRYAESVQLQSTVAPGASKPGAGPTLAFTAYGRAFQTDLEANFRVVRSLSPQKQRQLGATPYKGTLTGIAGSWVRLTRVGRQYSGAIWDGEELYLLAPAAEVAPMLETPISAPAEGELIFRLADTEGGALAGACGAASVSAVEASGSERYRALLSELASNVPMAAAAIQGEIEVSVLGDTQFGARFGTDAGSIMVSRMNVVDGIFAEQLGVFIVPTDLTVFTSGDDPFSDNDSISLLTQLGTYRNARPALAARAITHLMTGRDLIGNTVGIAYINGVCDARYGASLSEAGFIGDHTAPLIIAHELGHNFGAPHDNEPASPCASTPNGYLMNPYINSSTRFSACSVQRMQPVIGAASCLLPARISDVAVSVEPATISVPINRPYSFPVTVTALGNQPSQDVRLSFAPDQFPGAESVTATAGVTCSVLNNFSCNFGTLAAGESRQVVVNMRPVGSPGTYSGTASVSATVDRDSTNNSQPLTFTVFAGADVSIALAAPIAAVLVGDILEMTFDAAADGLEAASNTIATISLPSFFSIDSVTAANGSCTTSGLITCSLGNVPSGERRRIVVRAHPTQGSGTYSALATVRADNDGSSTNNQLSFNIAVSPRQDVGFQPVTAPVNQLVGAPFDYFIDVLSPGIEAVGGVVVNISILDDLVLQQVTTAAGACQITGSLISCPLGTLAAGSSTRISLRLVASRAADASFNVSVYSPRNDNRNNDSINVRVNARHVIDVRLDGSREERHLEGAGALHLRVESSGRDAATNVVVRAELPAGYPVTGATVLNGTCTVANTIAQCVLPTLPAQPGSTMIVEYTSSAPGTFTAAFSASAAGDGDLTNNQFSSVVSLEPYVDVRVASIPERIDAIPDAVIILPFVIATDRRNVNAVTFDIGGIDNMTVETVSAPDGGICTILSSVVRCAFGDLAANTTRRIGVTARVNASLTYSFTSAIYVRVSSPGDRNYSNDAGYVPVSVRLRGDAALTVAQTNVTTTRHQSFNLPTVTITSAHTLENVTVDFTLPTGFSLTSPGGANCYSQTSNSQASNVRCSLGTLLAATTHNLNLTLQPTSTAAGNATIDVRLSAPGDENAQNNSASIAVTVNEAPGGGTGGGGSSGGGGGGGSMGWQALLALLLLYETRRRRHLRPATPR